VGLLLQASRKNHVRRDGQEILGYSTIAADSKAAKAIPRWPACASRPSSAPRCSSKRKT
jgi:hypothetical protein